MVCEVRLSSRRRQLTATVLAVSALAACSPTSTSAPATDMAVETPAAPAPALPVRLVDSTGTTVDVTSIERILPVDGDLAEIVFALGLGDHVVATDLSATFPPAADALPEIGYQRALNVEPIASFDPTVVLATDLARPVEVLEQLRDLHIPVVVIERDLSLAGPAAKIRVVAEALGVPARGEALVASLELDLDRAIAAAESTERHPRVLVLYLRGTATQLILGAGTGVDTTLAAVGAVDVATELGVVDTRPLSAEAVLTAAPDVIVVTTSGLESVGGIDGLLELDGIARTPAGIHRRIIALEDQYLLGMGPRYGQLVAELVSTLASLY